MLRILLSGASSVAKVPSPTDNASDVRGRAIEESNGWALCHGVLINCLTVLWLDTSNRNRIAIGVGTSGGGLNGQANKIIAIGSIVVLWVL